MFFGGDHRRARCAGFSFVELVFVLVIAGVLAAVAIPRFVGRSAFGTRGYFAALASAARYAQQRAVAGGCHVQLRVTVTGFALMQPGTYCGSSFTSPVPRPGSGAAFTGTDPDPGAVGGDVPVSVVFNPDGSTDQGANVVIRVGSHTLTIQHLTGYAGTG